WFSLLRPPPTPTLSPYTTLFRSRRGFIPPLRDRMPSGRLLPAAAGEIGVEIGNRLDALVELFEPEALVGRVDRILREPEAHEQRSEEHTSELQSRFDLVCRLLLE